MLLSKCQNWNNYLDALDLGNNEKIDYRITKPTQLLNVPLIDSH